MILHFTNHQVITISSWYSPALLVRQYSGNKSVTIAALARNVLIIGPWAQETPPNFVRPLAGFDCASYKSGLNASAHFGTTQSYYQFNCILLAG